MIEYQKILFPYAYNILGSAEDARDVIQDVLSNYISLDKKEIADERNYLIKSVVNRSVNHRTRSRSTISPSEVWLPEPIATEDSADRNLELKEILSYSLLILLEKLQAAERAVFILKESFDYSHLEISEVLSITEEHSRKLLSRAKAKLFKPSSARQAGDIAMAPAILERYIDAIRSRDTGRLESLMSEDIAFYADGGKSLKVVAKECFGVTDVSALLLFVFEKFQSFANIVYTEVNFQPAFLYYNEGKLTACQVFNISGEGKILQINNVLDPAKLRNLGDQVS